MKLENGTLIQGSQVPPAPRRGRFHPTVAFWKQPRRHRCLCPGRFSQVYPPVSSNCNGESRSVQYSLSNLPTKPDCVWRCKCSSSGPTTYFPETSKWTEMGTLVASEKASSP